MTSKGKDDRELAAVTGRRNGPYRSFNPVTRTQIWQWCAAMGDRNPLYLDTSYQRSVGIKGAVAPPAMMQMWTMRDVNMQYAPGSSDARAYAVMDVLGARGYAGNVAVSYDLRFHRLLREGDRAHHYTSIDSVSPLKKTHLGEGHFFVEHAEFCDQNDEPFAEAYITYFQYRPAAQHSAASEKKDTAPSDEAAVSPEDAKQPVAAESGERRFTDLLSADVTVGDTLPELVIPITHKLIVSGALASQDFIDVHHNAPAARAAGMPDIFMNILTTCGLSARYLTDWGGPASRLSRLRLNLLAPNTPGDTMTFTGRVTELDVSSAVSSVGVEFAGSNRLGLHVSGSAALNLAS